MKEVLTHNTAEGHVSPPLKESEIGSPWRVLSELAEHAPVRRDQSLEHAQRTRLKGLGMASGSSFLVVLIAGGLYSFSMVSGDAFFWFGLFTALWNFGFYGLVRSGLNLRFRDPDLALPMMACANLVLLFLMACLSGGHAVLSLCYILPFVFGILNLRTTQMVSMAAFVLLGDFLIMVALRSETAGFEFDLLRWVSLALVLVWFAYMGGYIGGLRRHVNLNHERLSRAFETIKHMATHDELTGVLNRRHLVDVLNAEKARADRYGGQWSVCMIDIDHFKRVNDMLGHSAGDLVLHRFAQAAQRMKRPTDAFGRYGGEEFMMILVQTGLSAAEIVAERLRVLAAGLAFEGLDPNLRITISIGVAEARSAEDWQSTVDRADQALYRAKQSGRDRVVTATATTTAAVKPSAELQTSA